jgi:hypothetical protein
MAVTLDADPTSAGFNCYATVAEADDYFATRLHTDDWDGAVTSTKEKALLWATRLLNSLRWKGVRYSGTQNMEFPRRGLSYYETTDIGSGIETVDLNLGIGYYTKVEITETGVPDFLREATCELSLFLIGEDTTAPSDLKDFSRIKIDVIDIQTNKSVSNVTGNSWFNGAVKDLVWRFMLTSNPYIASLQRV